MKKIRLDFGFRFKVVLIVIAVALLIILALFAIFLPGVYVSDKNTVLAVEDQGYSNVQIVKSHVIFIRWHGCSSDDAACYKIRATNSLGKRVKLIACAGWPFKGVTVRK